MYSPHKLRMTPAHNYTDPLSSDRCEIEQHIIENYEPIGGYYLLEIENLPTVPVSEIERSYERILRILGINHA